MAFRDRADDLAVFAHPVPHPDALDPATSLDDVRAEIAVRRRDHADRLRAATAATGQDPLLLELRAAAARRDGTDRHIRDLIAYARHHTGVRPDYTWESLAAAAGIAYSTARNAIDAEDADRVRDLLVTDPIPAPTGPRHVPLRHDQLVDLAARMSATLLPATIGPDTPPLTEIAWVTAKVVGTLATLLDPNPPADLDRAGGLHDLVACADAIRHLAHRQWAAETSETDLAAFTDEQATTTAAEGAGHVESATLTLVLPDGRTRVTTTMAPADHHDPQPDGWTRWQARTGTPSTPDRDVPLAVVDGARHLEVAALLAALGEVVTAALPEDLLDQDG